MGTVVLVYGGLSLVIAAFGVAGLYHARKFRYPGDKTGVGSLLFVAAFGLIFVLALVSFLSNAGDTSL